MNNILSEIIFEEINNLINEGRDPIELINYKFSDVPEDIRERVLDADPTKKKSYTQWLLTLYFKDEDEVLDFIKSNDLYKYFNIFKERNVSVSDFNDIYDAYDYVDEMYNADDYDILYDSENWQIIRPNTYEAAKYLGKYTNWCTALSGYRGSDFWEDYSNMGPIFINIDKRKKTQRSVGNNFYGDEEFKTNYVKYQFLFEYDGRDLKKYTENGDWEEGMICDADNENLAKYGKDIPKILNIPEDVVKFYNSMGYYFENCGYGKELMKNELINNSKYIGNIGNINFYIANNPENNIKQLMGVQNYSYFFYDKNGEVNENDYVETISSNNDLYNVIIMNNNNSYYAIYYDEEESDVLFLNNIKKYITLYGNESSSYTYFLLNDSSILYIKYGELNNIADLAEDIMRYNDYVILAKIKNKLYTIIDDNIKEASEEYYNTAKNESVKNNNLLSIISEEIDRLIEEGKDPIELINYKFSNVPNNIRTKVLEADPTKKKSYSQWALTLYLTDDEEKENIEYFVDEGIISKLFKQAQMYKIDVSNLNSINDIRKAINTQTQESKYKVLYDSPEWQVLQPQTAEAAKKLGQYTNWCTAGSESNRWWEHYTNTCGDIFINIDKRKTEQRPVGKNANGQEEFKTVPVKYQFLFDYNNEYDKDDNNKWNYGMMCNSNNDNLAYLGKDLINKLNIPQDVVNFYEKNGYSFDKIGDGETIKNKYNISNNTNNKKKVIDYTFMESLKKDFFEKYNLIEKTIKNNNINII